MTLAATGKLDTILVATDFSETAEASLDWAIDLAKRHGASIDLVHSLALPNEVSDYIPSSHSMTEELQRAALNRLDESASRARNQGVEVKPELLLGLPSRNILEAAETDPAADLIVIGTRGLTGIRHLLLGSTAERVVKNAKCPVLSVHPHDVEQHRPLETVLVPTDFSEDADLAITAAARLLPAGGEAARLILLHAYALPFEYTAYGTIPTSFDYLADTEGEALEKLNAKAAELAEAGLQVDVVAKEGYPPDAIVDEAKSSGADLIAMGTQGRSAIANLLLGSTAERVVQHAGCPVLTVPRPVE
jgi:nucleotide-binding universal stress UspA family protein